MSSGVLDTNQGKVKWFNNKAGYGFISIVNPPDENLTDVFVHHSSLNVSSEIYKYLVQGEYVEFEVEKIKNKSHDYQASKVTGIGRGDLMCETRYKNKDDRRPEFSRNKPHE
tara:strand:- start:988 stop:1323 length:336 start_codon:yes stop_codon:yes gene_type:complete